MVGEGGPGPQQEDRPSVFSAQPAATSGESHPGFKTEGTLADEMTGVDPADLGITRKQVIFGLGGAFLTLCGIGGVVALIVGKGIDVVSSKPDQLSLPYEELIKKADVQKYAKDLSTEDKRTLLYNLATTDAYLEEADNSQWAGLVKHLETEGPKAFYGQMLSLSKSPGCLASNKTITYNSATNTSSCDIYPGFKNLDAKTKLEYVNKFNAMAKELEP